MCFETKSTIKIIYYLVIFLVVADRLILFFSYSFHYTGNDDVVFWQGAYQYSNGFFYEPYMFGQNYNFMLESVVAVPFIKMGVPYYIIFPIVSGFLSLFPFLLIGNILYRNRFFLSAILFTAIPLLLPIEFGILTSISRGFISGMFFLSFLIFPILKPQKTISIWLFSLSAGLGFILNPNTLIVTIPVGFFSFLCNYKNAKFYIISIFILTGCYLIEHFSKQFYIRHPDYLVHEMWKLEWTMDRFLYSFSHLDKLFIGVMPVVWIVPWLGLPLTFIISLILFRKNKIYGISLFLSFIFIIFMFGLNKVHDNVDSIYLSSSRMFLTLPLLLGISVYWLLETYPVNLSNRRLKIIFSISIVFFLVKASLIDLVLERHIGNGDFGPVAVMKIDRLKKKCNEIYSIAENADVELIIFAAGKKHKITEMEFYNYGCPCIIKTEIKSILNKYERRYWEYYRFESKIQSRFIFYGSLSSQIKYTKTAGYKIRYLDNNIYLIEHNRLPLKNIMALLNTEFLRR